MEPAQRNRMTEAEYLAWEATQEEKHEYVDGEVLAMSGASIEHARIQTNVIGWMFGALQGGSCEVYGSELRVLVDETGMYAYPDATIVCGEVDVTDTRPPSVRNAKVVVEVSSESSESYDLGPKAAHYRHRASVVAVLCIDSRRRWVHLQTRNADGTWTITDQTDGEVHLACIGAIMPLDAMYRGVTFEGAAQSSLPGGPG